MSDPVTQFKLNSIDTRLNRPSYASVNATTGTRKNAGHGPKYVKNLPPTLNRSKANASADASQWPCSQLRACAS